MGDRFEPSLVIGIETVRDRAVDVEDADELVACAFIGQYKRNDKFRTRCRIAGDVAGERMDVGDALGRAGARGGPAHALVEGNAHAGRQALERTDHQLGAVEEIKPDPVELRQRVIDQRRQVGGVGDPVGLAGHQRACLRQQLRVLLRFAPGEIGGIEVKGPNVCAGYWRNPEKTVEACRNDGFFITGDLGMIDDRGYVSIVGRDKDLVISGGLNVYPKEVENLPLNGGSPWMLAQLELGVISSPFNSSSTVNFPSF